MADLTNDKKMLVTVALEDGEELEATLTTKKLLDLFGEASGEKLAEKEALKMTNLGGNFFRLDIDLSVFSHEGYDFSAPYYIPIEGKDTTGLSSKVPYYAFYNGDGNIRDAPLMATIKDAFFTVEPDKWEVQTNLFADDNGNPLGVNDVFIYLEDDDGKETPYTFADIGLDPSSLYVFCPRDTDDALTVGDLMLGMLITEASYSLAAKIIEEQLGKQKDTGAVLVHTGKLFTQSMKATTKRGTLEHAEGGEYIMAGDLMISTPKKGELVANVGMSKTLAWLNHLATTSGYGYEHGRNCTVSTSVGELLETRGLEDTRKNREAVRRDIKSLARWAWEWEDKNTHEWTRVPLAGSVSIHSRGGRIDFSISSDFMRTILNSRAGLMPADPALLRTNDRLYPHAFTVGWKLTTHRYQNAGEANENTLSVKSLLEYVETIPKPEEVGHRHYTRRIIEPLEKNLDHLIEIGVLAEWDYCHTKGEPLTDEEQDARLDADGNDRALPYDIAIKANIQWQFTNTYEEHIQRTLAARERNREHALEARAAAEKRRERIDRKAENIAAKEKAKRELENR